MLNVLYFKACFKYWSDWLNDKMKIVLVMTLCAVACCAMQSYKPGDKVEIFVNKVGPYFNPHETYHYYSLPVCRPEKIEHKSLTLGEVLDGDRMAYSLYSIKFQQNEENKKLCTVSLGKDELEKMREAVEELYYFEMVADDLQMRSFVGQFEESSFLTVPHVHKLYLYNHLTFQFKYNQDKVKFRLKKLWS